MHNEQTVNTGCSRFCITSLNTLTTRPCSTGALDQQTKQIRLQSRQHFAAVLRCNSSGIFLLVVQGENLPLILSKVILMFFYLNNYLNRQKNRKIFQRRI
jgi:hypothetical protein